MDDARGAQQLDPVSMVYNMVGTVPFYSAHLPRLRPFSLLARHWRLVVPSSPLPRRRRRPIAFVALHRGVRPRAWRFAAISDMRSPCFFTVWKSKFPRRFG